MRVICRIVFIIALLAIGSFESRAQTITTQRFAGYPAFANETATLLCAAPNGLLFIAGRNELAGWDGSTYHRVFSIETANDRITALAHDSVGNLWVATNFGLWRADKRLTFERFGAAVIGVKQLFCARNGSLYAASDSAVFSVSPNGARSVVSTKTIGCEIRSITEDRDGAIWVSTNGLTLFVIRGASIKRYKFDVRYEIMPTVFRGHPVARLSDSSHYGTAVLLPQRDAAIRNEPGLNAFVEANTALRGASEAEIVWHHVGESYRCYSVVGAGASSGLYANAGETSVKIGAPLFKGICFRENAFWTLTSDGLQKTEILPISYQKLHSRAVCFIGNSGGLWVGTRNGLVRAPLSPKEKPYLTGLSINDLSPRAAGGFWIATNRGVYFYDTLTKNIVKSGILPDRDVLKITQSKTDILTYELKAVGGLRRFALNAAQTGITSHESYNDSALLGVTLVYSFLKDVRGDIWVACNEGLLRWLSSEKTLALCGPISAPVAAVWQTPETGVSALYQTGDVIALNVDKNASNLYENAAAVGALTAQQSPAGIWCYTAEKQLQFIKPSGERFLISSDTEAPTYFRTAPVSYRGENGALYFPWGDGYVKISPKAVETGKTFILAKGGEGVRYYFAGDTLQTVEGETITVEIGNTVSSQLVSDFSCSQNGSTVKVGVGGTIRIPDSLPAGIYPIQISIGGQAQIMYVSLTPKFYRLPAFQMAAVTATILLAAILWNWLSKSRMRRALQIEREARLADRAARLVALRDRSMALYELMSLQNQISPHFVRNSMGLLSSLIWSGRKKESVALVGLLSDFITDNSYHQMPLFVGIAEDIEFLQNYLKIAQMRYPEMFDFSIVCEGDESINDLRIPRLFTQPYVENAVEHGMKNLFRLDFERKGNIHIVYRREKDRVVVTITDNGVGFEATRALKSTLPINPNRSSEINRQRLLAFSTGGEAPDIGVNTRPVVNEFGFCEGAEVVLSLPILSEWKLPIPEANKPAQKKFFSLNKA